jgi:hypothetical protein
LSRIIAGLLLAALCSVAALAVDLPTRKAGPWEIKMARSGGALPDMTMQHCTDAATDKQMTSTLSAPAAAARSRWTASAWAPASGTRRPATS